MESLLALDIGNSRIKTGIFIGGTLHRTDIISFTDNVPAYLGFWADKYGLEGISYTNVHARPTDRLFSPEKFSDLKIREITALTPAPIHNAYAQPEKLGADRFAASVAAKLLTEPGTACLVIDIGTAITYDWTDNYGFFRGGAISPGLDLRFRALHQFTARLPFVRPETNSKIEILGQDTKSCIQSGVVGGVIFEIKGMIEAFRQKSGEKMVTFATGGGADILAHSLKSIVDFLKPDLVPEGIYHITAFNEKPMAYTPSV